MDLVVLYYHQLDGEVWFYFIYFLNFDYVYKYVCLVGKYIHVTACALEATRGHWVPWHCHYRWMMWVLETKHGSSGEAICTLNCMDISLASRE